MRWLTVRSRFSHPPQRGVVRHRRRGRAAALVALALLATSVGSSEASGSPIQAADDPKVISDWNAIAFDTIVVDAGKANAEAFMWFAFEQAAVYNAVVGITGRYELYNWNDRGPRGASPQAAAAVAAHDVLLEYFPASQSRLDTALAASLAEIPDGPAKNQGIRYGERGGRPAHRAPRGRRPFRADHVRCPACARRLAPDPGPDHPACAVLRPVAVAAAAAAARFAQPVPAGSASSVDLPKVRGRFQRGEGGGFGSKHGPDARTDGDRSVHRREHLPARHLIAA